MSTVDLNPVRGDITDREREAFVLVDGKMHKTVYSRLSNALVQEQHDAITVAYPSSTVEVFSYKLGGVSGTLVATVTVTYVNSSKKDISSVVRT